MSFWQNQLNFAVWCTATGCGVDFKNHLKDDGLIGSVFRFHAYYQTRRLLFEMGAALPGDSSWNAFSNDYNRSAYARICQEFDVDVNTDWRINFEDNWGLGRMYYWHPEFKRDKPYDRGTKYSGQDGWVFSFTKTSNNNILHVDYIEHEFDDEGWSRFILDDSKGF